MYIVENRIPVTRQITPRRPLAMIIKRWTLMSLILTDLNHHGPSHSAFSDKMREPEASQSTWLNQLTDYLLAPSTKHQSIHHLNPTISSQHISAGAWRIQISNINRMQLSQSSCRPSRNHRNTLQKQQRCDHIKNINIYNQKMTSQFILHKGREDKITEQCTNLLYFLIHSRKHLPCSSRGFLIIFPSKILVLILYFAQLVGLMVHRDPIEFFIPQFGDVNGKRMILPSFLKHISGYAATHFWSI